MNPRLLLHILVLAISLSLRALGADDPAQPQERKVRVVCRYTHVYFDVTVSLKGFAGDLPPQAFLDAVAKQTAKDYTREWIVYLRITRWDESLQRFLLVDRLKINDRKAFLDALQDGDILTFCAPVCIF